MRGFVTVALAIAGMLTAGCRFQVFQVSVQPFFAASESPGGLAGRWLADGEESDGLELEPVAGGYRVHLFSDGTDAATPRRQCIGLARLGRVADELYWDLTVEPSADANDVTAAHLVRLHSVARVRLDGDSLTIALLDPDWLGAALADGRVGLPHVTLGPDDAPLLTASTDDLVRFLEAYGDDPDAFRDVGSFHRGL